MAEFKLDRFKYNWRGDWTSSTVYKRDDIVRVNGKSYVCVIGHTSSIFRQDLDAILEGSTPPQPAPRWVVMTSGKTFVGDWAQGTEYNLGDLVVYNGNLWECIQDHLAATFFADINHWTEKTLHQSFEGDWQQNTAYGPGALLKYNGIVYRCVQAHLSQSTLEDNISDWEVFNEGVQYVGEWQPSTEYRKNDLVKYGATIFRCNETHTSNPTNLDDVRFDLEFPGSQNNGEWENSVFYNQGDIVKYGGFLYFAVNNNIDTEPSGVSNDSTQNWIILASAYRFVDDWSITTVYRTGDLVLRGGDLYLAKADINTTATDGSSADYLDPDLWELVNKGQNFVENWNVGNYYSVGHVVYHLGTAYKCNFEHESIYDNSPGDNGSGYEYWDTLIQAGVPGGLHDKGDLLTYGPSRENYGDGSTLGDTRVAIGEESEALSISADLEVFWRRFLNDSDVIYVSPLGEDDDGYGISFDKPFRSVRFACEYVEDNFDPLSPVKISVATGKYEEKAPLSVPAGCAVVGDELRATVISANKPIPAYQDALPYVTAYNIHITSILEAILLNQPATLYPGNDVEQVIDEDALSNGFAAIRITELMTDYESYIRYRVANGDTDPTNVGTNEPTTELSYTKAAQQLLNNRKLIAKDAFLFLQDTYPNETFDERQIREDIYAMLRGIRIDLQYSGNHRTLLAARRWTNAALGSQLDDMFYMRDTTGLRNCTTEGLEGTLRPPQVFELYQRPTGGACVSLDPGWGPEDERTWIMNRSPYIQGVTNIGTGCIGKKVDGNLHNGGNKSMTSNDFTQVLSDGIGAWITNNARAELVSVFTYYCQIGYFAENGGIIRATNGNNSYGSFGSIAQGNDQNEVPDDCLVWNRNNEAQVKQAFAGGANDHIYVFEYTNTGQEYTEADAEIIGAGDFADVEYNNFRHGALSEARLINTQGSGSEGGSGFLIRQGYAQVTVDSTSSITLSATDITDDISEIVGCRILIIAGDGAGQYGYIADYDQVTKVVDVLRDSDNQPGWDHVVPGTPIETSLDSTAQYRIEPRIIASKPNFTFTNRGLPASRNFVDITFGGHTKTYIGLFGQVGTGDTFDGEPATAEFRVERAGDNYTVTIVDGGLGYAVGDTITIQGSQLGGASPANDLVLTITSVSDDSSNSILTFTQSGTPVGDRFILIDNAQYAYFSENGVNWQERELSFEGTYTKVISGLDRFIALSLGENRLSFSYDGDSWITRSLPSTEDWIDGTFGKGTFVIIGENSINAAYSTNGLNWTAMTLPTGDDSSGDQWQAVEYGAGHFIAISGSNTKDVAYSTDGINWNMYSNVIPAGDYDWVSLVYQNNRFIAIDKTGKTIYSLDNGENWYVGGEITYDSGLGAVPVSVKDVKAGNGMFVAVGDINDVATNFIFQSQFGLTWEQKEIGSNQNWTSVVYSVLNDVGTFVAVSSNSTVSGSCQHIRNGAQVLVKADVFQGSFQNVLIWDPGSGYTDATPPTFTITDNFFVVEVEIETRLGNKALPQPDFINRGSGYRSSSSEIAITGDGFADIIPEENTLTLSGVSVVPGPGVQIRIDGILDPDTVDPDDLDLFTGVAITDLGDDGSGNGTRLVEFTISPKLRNEYNLQHLTGATLRSRYSQCRVSGHDFLDIGTGNFEETNYPEIYAGGRFFTAAPENEVLELDGGRVFYVSTDQDGNFRGGELFSVEQATGVVTISAEFFDLDGLSELALGGVRLGGTGTVVREFSTDPTMSEDSNNVIPTQRAVTTFLEQRLSVGGENLEANNVIAGRVSFGTVDNVIRSASDEYVFFQVPAYFDGVYTDEDEVERPTGISGTIISQMLFFKGFDETMQ